MKSHLASVAVLGLTMLIAPHPSYAEDPSYSAGPHVDTGLHLRIPGHGKVGTYTYEVVSSESAPGTAYCIDLEATYREGAALRESTWSEVPSIEPYADQVAWLLHNSYPYLPLDQVRGTEHFHDGLSIAEAVAATQAAVWHYSDGITLQAAHVAGSGEERDDVMALYSRLTGPANTGMDEVPETTVALTLEGPAGVAGGRIGPIRLATNNTAALTLKEAPDDVRIVDAAGNPLSRSSSGELFIDVPAGTDPGAVSITASAEALVPTGRIFTPTGSDAETSTQTLVLATVDTELVEASVEVPWRAAPRLSTTATDRADGDKTVLPGGTVTDLVQYDGFVPGVEYTVVGELVDLGSGRPTGATGHTTFTPRTTHGTVQVEIPVSAHAKPGTQLVVFERAYDVHGDLVAQHADLRSAPQTVSIDSPDELPVATGPVPAPQPSASTIPAPAPSSAPPSTEPLPAPRPSASPVPSLSAPVDVPAPGPVPEAADNPAPPSSVPAPVPAPTPAGAPLASPAAKAQALADTGAESSRWALAAGVLLLIGTGASLLARRR